ncbi:heme-degrading domain-containing protein [Clostridium ganghwense]|uniref:UPF0303 protein OXH55_16515 n=1 Tax=Clostridium ganghwense TaxID=312089 RepID=A0ABT4CVJ9_9CLOT|nr:heme-degrading domain-containing protein [Clostridium ganghwense]MCY6372236.1 heme-degrading domain-containing protein [Clostridium ganghwense]
MPDYDKMLKEFKKQEEILQFTKFTSETALEIGMKLIEKAKNKNIPITVDIVKNGHQLFHYSSEGTSPDNDQWIIRKNKVVNRFHTSSLYIGTKLKMEEKTLEEKYHISSKEYLPYGGAFPLIIKNVGVVGTISVSGSRQIIEHNLIVEVLTEILSN